MTWFVPDLPIEPLLWHVCFVGKERHSPWDWFLPAGYRHVFLLGYLPGTDQWLRYEVLFHRTEISVVSTRIAGRYLQTAVEAGGVLAWPAPRLRPSWWPRFGFWCVPAVKHVLGLRCVAVTPKGLHDWLVRNGAKPLLPEEHHEPVLHPQSACA